MRVLLLGVAAPFAAIAFAATPAQAQTTGSAGFTATSGVSVHHGFEGHRSLMGRPVGRHDRRGNRGFDGDVFIGEWPQQGDTAWRSDSFNDWWHDRPDRAYPRWMSNNANCERRWWSGGGWRC